MIFDYRKLNGRIKEKFGTQARFANAIGLSERSLCLKLNNKINFKQDEIIRICEVLSISYKKIPLYFFTLFVQYR
ncbi:MAG: DUF739 family protein [Oscillospiraceae bacterium]|nr:DUF739 family protein [Oscillospiraceae bacterium]